MNFFCVSFTHKNTSLAIREKISFSDDGDKKEILRLINANSYIDESLILSTCNRIEIFAITSKIDEIADYMISCIALLCKIDKNILFQQADIFENVGAIHHLFSVASSLDSLVIGETQITGQLKDALNFSKNFNFCGNNLEKAVYFAFKCAAKIRNETEISKNNVSVASVAVTKAKELINLNNKEVIIIGAGKMSKLIAKHLIQNNAKVIIINRNQQKAKELINELGINAKSVDFSKLNQFLNTHEVFFSATNATNPIITNDLIKAKNHKRYFFDIAVPRNIDISENEYIKVFYVDDLQDVVKQNLTLRENQAQMAYSTISIMTNNFFKYINDLISTPIIKALRLKAKDCAELELKKALKKGYLKFSDKNEAKKLIHQVFKAFLHQPTINLKNLKDDTQNDEIINSISYIFDLDIDYKDSCNLKEYDEI